MLNEFIVYIETDSGENSEIIFDWASESSIGSLRGKIRFYSNLAGLCIIACLRTNKVSDNFILFLGPARPYRCCNYNNNLSRAELVILLLLMYSTVFAATPGHRER